MVSRILIIVLGFFCSFEQMILGQTGPAGIMANDGTTDLVLWLDASQLSGLASDQKIQTWKDASGYSHNATQATEANRPTYKTSLLNSLPVVSFLEANATDLSGTIADEVTGDFGASATIIALVKFDDADQGTNQGMISTTTDNDYVISIGSDGPIASNSGGEMTAIARRKDLNGNEDKYYTYDGTETDISNTAVLDDNANWYIIVQIMRATNSPNPYHQAYVDGSNVAYSSSSYSGPLDSNGIYEIGDWTRSADFGDTYHLNGDIAELMVFKDELNIAELNVIHSYLIGKWNGTAATDIDISSGTTFTDSYRGDLAAQDHHDMDIIGVGRHNATNILESAAGAGLSLTSVTNYGDADYLIGGHKLATNNVTSDGLVGNQQRWSRVWYFDFTDAGSAATTTIKFDISDSGMGDDFSGNATNYDIIYKETSGGSWSFLSASSTYDGDQITFSGLDLSGNGASNGDGYYTLATTDKTTSILGVAQAELGDKGPGGIENTDGASNLALWLDPNNIVASDGDKLNSWLDASGYNAGPAQNTSDNQPEYDTDGAPNGVPTLLFDGTDDFLEGNLASTPSAPITIAAVGFFGILNQGDGNFDNDYIVSVGTTDNSETEHIGIARRKDELPGPGETNQNVYYSWRGQTPSYGPSITGQQWTMITSTHNTTSQFHEVYFEGAKQTSPSPDYGSSFTATASDFDIGRWVGAENYITGEIAEIIIFDEVLNAARLNILHSYLSAKYEVALTSNDKYTGDDLGNGGVCDGVVTCQPNYDLNVAGVGNVGSGGSSVSNSSATSAGLNVAMTSAETTDGGVDDTFDDGDYMLFGHNVSDNERQTSDIATSSTTIETRSKRDWFFDVTESDATKMKVDLTFDFSEMGLSVFPKGTASNYKLLFRTTNESGDSWEIIASASNINGDQVEFTDVTDIDEDAFVTIGTIDETNSPLPIGLVSFEARVQDNEVVIDWETSYEQDNALFTIQRSDNGLDFEDLIYVEGSGNSFDLIQYSKVDSLPIIGNSYYRLKQVDTNGNYDISRAVRVHVEKEHRKSINVYPNPARNEVNIDFAGLNQEVNIRLMNKSGIVLKKILVKDSSVTIPVYDIPEGLYFLEFTSAKEKFTTKLLIQR